MSLNSKLLIPAVFFAVILSACAAPKTMEAEQADVPDSYWWTKLDFTPKDSAVRGIPVEKLDPSWRRASELKKGKVPPEGLINGVDMMEEEDVHFSIEDDFNQDGAPDLATVGVYETKTGSRGNFVLILTREPSGEWRRVYLHSGKQTPGFVALRWRDGILEVWPCLECDLVDLLRWSARFKEYILVPQHAPLHFATADIERFEESLKENPGAADDINLSIWFSETLNTLAWAYSTYPEYRTDAALRRRALDYAERGKGGYGYPEAYGAALYANGKTAEGDAWFDRLIQDATEDMKPYYRETKENVRELYSPKKN